MSSLRSKFEAESEASIIAWSALELEGKAISPRGSEAWDVVLELELNSVSGSEGLSEGNRFRVKEDSIKFDFQLASSEWNVIVSGAQLS